MSKDLNNSAEQNSPNINEDDTEKSLVGKFKSIISNTPLSKWFPRQDDNSRSTIRRREEEDEEENDDEIVQMQPPAKRAKFPNSVNFSHLSSSENSFISEKVIHKAYNYFPEPVAGPSGLNSQKLLNSVNNPSSARNAFSSDLLNGHKDSDSEESTSGYSSVARIGSKEHVSHSEGSSKQPSPLQTNSPNARSLFQSPVVSTNRSLFSERTTSPKLNTSLSLRRPSFNASTFGSPNFVDKTISTEKIINSPFYNGTTIYGGASAYGRKLGRSSKDLRASLRKSIHIKPVNKAREGGNQVLGKTARKILETLEQYSTPVNDAKKIPVASKRFRPDSSLLGKHVGVNPYAPSPSNRELQVPTVSDLLKMKQKAKLQSSTEAVRQIATSSQSDFKATSPQSVVNISDKNKKTPEKSDGLEKFKEKTKDSTQPQLPITSLPKFDLNIPATVTKKTEKVVTSLADKPTVSPTSKPQNVLESRANVETNKNFQKDLPLSNNLQFKFSNPLIIAENLKSIVAMNNFKFSEPLSNWNKTDTNSSIVTPFVKPIKEKNNGQNINKDPSLLNKFKPATGTWECSTCLIRNQADKTKCLACEAPNPKLKPAQPETKKPFGDKFKMSDGMWECPVCMIRNSNDSAKCIACETANPKSPTLVSSSSSFQAKFKPPADSWECSTCLIRNKEELLKCAACETPKITKPAGVNQLANSFKMKEDQWECTVCLVRNQSDHAKCQCCEASKPGASSNVVVQETKTKPVPKFNFGIDQKAAALFSFGIPPSSKKPSSPKPAVEPVAAVVLGETAKTSNATPAPTFSFGVIPKAQEKEKTVDAPKPAENKTASPAPAPSTAVVKPVLSMPEKPETKSVLKSTMAAIPVITTDSKDSSSTKPTTAVASFDAATKPTFNFGAKFDKKVKDTTFVPPVPKFEFNKPANTAAPKEVQKQPSVQPAAQVFSFGGASKPVNSSPPVFGQKKMPTLNNSLEVKAAPMFAPTTGSPLRTSVPKPVGTKPYSFTKQESGEPATKAAMFNFGQSAGSAMNPPTTQQPSGFNFGSVTKTPFNFSAGKTETATTGTSDLFGGSNAAGNKNGIFTFGNGSQATVPPKTGFNFGAPSAPSTGFNFGTSPAAPAVPAVAPTGGFNFTAPFDANVKPSYNFSDSPVTFAAQATDGGLAGPRKIKRAVRRTR